MSQLIDFYRGTGTDYLGRTLETIWSFSDVELESIHDFIQWMFPLREASQFNPDAPRLTDEDVAEFHADPQLRRNLLRSFEVFLAFLGLHIEAEKVARAVDFDGKKRVFAAPNLNWLRITRVLISTRTLGLERHSRAFFDFLKSYRDSGLSGITPDTFRYWANAATAETST